MAEVPPWLPFLAPLQHPAPMLHFDGLELIAAAAGVERRWRLEGGLLRAVSLRDPVAGREWLEPITEPSIVPPAGAPQAPVSVVWSRLADTGWPYEAPAERGELTVTGADGRGWRLQIWLHPDGAEVSCRLDAAQVAVAATTTERSSGIEGEAVAASRWPQRDLCERLRFAAQHLTLTEPGLTDRTDGFDTLVQPRNWRLAPNERIAVPAALVAVEDVLTRDGLVIVRQAPLPQVRPDVQGPDVIACGRDLAFCGNGWTWTVMPYRGGAWGRTGALHAWQRRLRRAPDDLDGALLSNTWGDRSRDGRIREDFLLEEIRAGAELGVEVTQIDSGWQRGIDANSVKAARGGVWEGFRAADPGFWEEDRERLPRGLAPLAEAVRARGMRLGLWFAPDSSRDFADWELDAQRVLELHRQHGVRNLKIDAMKLRSRLACERLERFARAVAPAVAVDIDCTAEERPGHYGLPGVGPIFVENRYSDWHNWWPHATLRNLWDLSHWVAPQRLRMEFLNPYRNAAHYTGDPLAPLAWPLEYPFATVMVACPLLWGEVSALPPAFTEALRPLIATWKRWRPELRAGTVLPVGGRPDGAAWTGFCVVGSGYVHLLAFREQHAEASAAFSLPVPGRGWTRLGGRGDIMATEGGAQVTIPAQRDWAWFRAEHPG